MSGIAWIKSGLTHSLIVLFFARQLCKVLKFKLACCSFREQNSALASISEDFATGNWSVIRRSVRWTKRIKVRKSYVSTWTEYAGRPDCVPVKAGIRSWPSSSANLSRVSSPDKAYADKQPPKYRIVVSKNPAWWSGCASELIARRNIKKLTSAPWLH